VRCLFRQDSDGERSKKHMARQNRYSNNSKGSQANRVTGFLINGVVVVVTLGTLKCASCLYRDFIDWYTIVDAGRFLSFALTNQFNNFNSRSPSKIWMKVFSKLFK
jgi:hypothetical protein